MTAELNYIKHILKELQDSLSKETVLSLYQKHETAIALYNKKKEVIHQKQPCPNISTFRTTLLPAILILELQNSLYAGYLANLSHGEIASLLGANLTKELVHQMETKIYRTVKHPRNKHLIYGVQDTIRTLSSPKDTDLSTF